MFHAKNSSTLFVWVIIHTFDSNKTIVMDFIVNLLFPKTFDSIFIIVNYLIKIANFILYNKAATSESMTRLFIDNIYKYHDFFNNIIFDCNMQFTLKF